MGHRSAGGVPTWANIARGGGVSVNVIIGGSSGRRGFISRLRPGGEKTPEFMLPMIAKRLHAMDYFP
jgi:hypothetical protein